MAQTSREALNHIPEAQIPCLYQGSGTEEDPFVVEFLEKDTSNPMNWPLWKKWLITTIATSSVFAVTFTSSAYSAPVEIRNYFGIDDEVFELGVSLLVLGFAIGPSVWGPLPSTDLTSFDGSEPSHLDKTPLLIRNARSELHGRRILWLVSHIGMVGAIGGCAAADDIATILVLRLLAGIFGGSPLVNSGGTIADIFGPSQRGLAMTLYCVAPFLGPVLGPIVGGLVSENVGWRWVQGVCGLLLGLIGLLGAWLVPETRGPNILEGIARKCHDADGKIYVTIVDKGSAPKRTSQVLGRAFLRPWALLFREIIVFLASLYIAITYGTVYMFMGAMPVVFNEDRGWSEAIGGLAFLGITVGMFLGLVYAIADNYLRYTRISCSGKATAETRLPPAMLGAVCLPVGMFAFAWTNDRHIHWAVSIVVSAPFGFGCVLVILPIVNYLIDSYTIYSASVLAAAAFFRSLVGGLFPLFTTRMYHHLGIHWAASIPAFLTLACMPFPFVMYRYGEGLRMRCKYASEAAELIKRLNGT